MTIAAALFLASMQRPHLAGGLRPNFLVIRVDDARADDMEALRPDGTPVMRNLQSLVAANGMTFTNNFAPLSLCCPSRAAFFSGQYARSNNVFDNVPPFGGAGRFDHANSLAPWLHAAGYFTGHIGKYMNGHDGSPLPGWDWWETRVDLVGQGLYYGYNLNDNGTVVHFGSSIREYSTDVFTQKALQFLSDRTLGADPFLLVLDYDAPHGAPVPAARHQHVFDNATFQWGPAFNEADVSDKPIWVQQLPPISQAGEDGITDVRRARLGCLLAVDEGIGQIVQSLHARGLADSTYLIFLSDNGYMEGEHRIPGGKDFPYEESVRVPLAISGPGVRAGAICDQLVANIDMAPTMLELAGANAGRVMDGLSLVPAFSGGSIGRERLLIEGWKTTPPFSLKRSYTGIRTPAYVYIETDQNGNGAFDPGVDAQELYPLDVGPYELESRHADPIYAALLAEMHARLQALETCSGGTCQ